MNEPTSIVSGDSVSWTESSGLYSAPTWTLKYELRGPNKITITAAQNGSTTGWIVTLHSADTVGWTPGIYVYQAHVTSGADRHTLWSGTTEVLIDLSEAPDAYASISHVRETLAEIETAIEKYMGNPYARIVIAGREKENVDMVQLVKMRTRYKYYLDQEIAKEKMVKGLDSGRRIFTRFVRPK